MLIIIKKRKCVWVNFNLNEKNNNNQFDQENKLIQFNGLVLNQLSKCKMMHYDIDDLIISNIPKNIINIQFTREFNQNILPYLNENIIRLSFGDNFNRSVSNLPQFLIDLQFGYDFNQDVSNLPVGLKRLAFGHKFNNLVEYLPDGIEHLTFGYYFNQDISNLPHSIKFIGFGCKFNNSIDGLALNKNLSQIVFIPSSMFDHDIKILPPNLKLISFPFEYTGKINLTHKHDQIECIKLSALYPKENFVNLEKYISNNIVIFDNEPKTNWITLKTFKKYFTR